MKNGLFTFHDGTKHWFKNNKLHREDGPAIIYTNGTQYWYQHGKRHRLNGPAAIFTDGSNHYYINDEYITETWEDFQNHLIQENLKTLL